MPSLKLRLSGISPRAKFVLVTVLTLLPFSAVLLFVALTVYLPVFNTMEKMVHDVMNEVLPVTRLQNRLLNAAMPPNDYLINGSPEEGVIFEALSQQVEAIFEEVARAHANDPDATRQIDEAHQAWRDALSDGADLLTIEKPIGNQDAMDAMEHFDEDIRIVVDLLDAFHNDTEVRMLERHKAVVNLKDRGILLTGLAFSMALLLGVGGSIFLTRERSALVEKSARDGLTGLYNRRECNERLKAATADTLSFDRPFFSMMMVDLDHFKAVNDTHGHQAGDAVLKKASQVAAKQLRVTDFFGRYGGEEFIILLPGTDRTQAHELAERLRLAIAETPISVGGGKKITVTASIGVSMFPDDAENEADLVEAADKALYVAKEKGRNRVELYRAS